MIPVGAADRTEALGGEQDTRAPGLVGLGLLVGWAALVCAGAGIDLADGLGGPGSAGLAFGLVVSAAAATWVVIVARDAAAFRAPASIVALAGAGGLVTWTAASIWWAAAPDLAWLDANRMALAFSVLVAAVGLGALIQSAGRRLAIGLSVVAVAPVAWALATKLLPASIAGESGAGRLSEPVTYSNAMGLITVIAVPGALVAAMQAERPRWIGPAAAAWVSVLIVACFATLSRSSLILLVVVAAIAIGANPRWRQGVATAAAGAIGAIVPASFVVASDALTSVTASGAARTTAGAGLAWRLVVGIAIAVVAMALYERWAARKGAHGAAATGLVVALVAGGALALAPAPAEAGWSAPSAPPVTASSLSNENDRLTSGSFNNRTRWWDEAFSGWTDAPLIGEGAGGFRIVQLQQREDNQDRLRTVEPHQALLRTLSGTGLIGGVLLIAMLVGLVWGAVNAARRGPWLEVGGPAAILAAIVLQSLADWTLAIPALTAAGAAAAGVLLAHAAPGRAEPRRESSAGAALAPTAVVLAVLAIASGVLPWASQQAVAASQNALADGDVDAALDRADLAETLNPLSPEPIWAQAEAYAVTGEPARALGAYLRATELQPDNPATWRRVGLAAGDSEIGVAAWQRALVLDPQDEQGQVRSTLPPEPQ